MMKGRKRGEHPGFEMRNILLRNIPFEYKGGGQWWENGRRRTSLELRRPVGGLGVLVVPRLKVRVLEDTVELLGTLLDFAGEEESGSTVGLNEEGKKRGKKGRRRQRGGQA